MQFRNKSWVLGHGMGSWGRRDMCTKCITAVLVLCRIWIRILGRWDGEELFVAQEFVLQFVVQHFVVQQFVVQRIDSVV